MLWIQLTEVVLFFPRAVGQHCMFVRSAALDGLDALSFGLLCICKNLLKTFTTVRFEKGSDGMLNAENGGFEKAV